jgi:ferritin-like metal-binding protein YciE
VARPLCPKRPAESPGDGPPDALQTSLWVEKIQQIIDATLQTKPKGMTQWSCRRLMAKAQGVSKSTVGNVWRSHNLKPRLQAVPRS